MRSGDHLSPLGLALNIHKEGLNSCYSPPMVFAVLLSINSKWFDPYLLIEYTVPPHHKQIWSHVSQNRKVKLIFIQVL